MYKEEFHVEKKFFIANLFLKNWTELSSGKIVSESSLIFLWSMALSLVHTILMSILIQILLILLEKAHNSNINIHGPNIKICIA